MESNKKGALSFAVVKWVWVNGDKGLDSTGMTTIISPNLPYPSLALPYPSLPAFDLVFICSPSPFVCSVVETN